MRRPAVVVVLASALLVLLVLGFMAPGRQTSESIVQEPSPTPQPSACDVTPVQELHFVGPNGPITMRAQIGGRLASIGESEVVVGRRDKHDWLLREGPWPQWITLHARSLDTPDEQFFYISLCDNCGVPDASWGSRRAYGQGDFEFRKTGCWRLQLVNGQPEDFVVLRVVPRTP